MLLKVNRKIKWLLISGGAFVAIFLILNVLFPLKTAIDYSTIIVDKRGEVIHGFLSKDDKWRMMTELQEISPTLRRAIVHKEDRFFYYHPGFNPISILRAFYNNLRTGRRTSGASTITMQVARLLEPKERSYGNKLVELFRALQLEWKYSKDEILQLYLNLVPYGGNIEGVKAAAIIFFEKSPNQLSLAEVTALALVPNRPTSLALGKNNTLIQEERDRLLARFRDKGLFPDRDIVDALEEDLAIRRNEVPRRAPHLAYRLKSNFGNQPIISSTIELQTQQTVEALVSNYVNRLYHRNIKNAAVLVVDNSTNEVKAYVGSADFNNDEDGGQVDGVRAIRSPGSTLKPLLYGVAIDRGSITPKTVIADVPTSFGNYAPENYDEKFYGNVNIEYSLSNSLNVPAVKVLDRIGVNELITTLRNADFSKIDDDADKLGLSMVLGGCGVTLEQLTRLYSAFAADGVLSELHYTKMEEEPDTLSIISAEANYMITEILLKVTRPDLPLQWQNSANLPRVAWKTGTSYGRRDAWSIGYNRNYTIGVWVGNFSAQGVPELAGATTAAPLLFRVFNAIDQNSAREWFVAPEELDIRFVCSETGMPANDFCTNQIMDYFIPGVSPNEKCNHLRPVYVNADATESYCTTCLPATGYKVVHYHNHAPEIITWFESENITYLKPPPHNPLCERVFVEGPPSITSPIDGLEYYVNKEDSMQLMLSADVNNDVDKVFWYIDDKFYQSTIATENVFFSPKAGRVKISCTDDKGRNSNIFIEVKAVSL